ncbi:hypothetical protein F5144DRAFT_621383 [Chaetomium tenue]|uniref:Uncharacterized protein n=1 Tax=Chaetomium tenue TaxID=1854479 RepID=A0ACB7PB41_9PEZI|nr:hypothetical protein F5144DRAFT_621383 [Chaetomium globosum]
MLVKSVAAFAALAFAANVAAEPMPYRPTMMKTSTRALFGIARREEQPGYQPEEAMCNDGNTCEEACGAGYQTCSSTDSQVHCFNPTVGELCCPDQSGNSCEEGYYCTADTKGETWCCPEGMDLAACAAAYSVTGGLVSQTPPPATSTSTTSTSTSTSTTKAPITTTTTTSSSSSTVARNTTSVAVDSPTSAVLLPSASSIQSNSTSVSTVKPAQPTESKVEEGAGNIVGPATALVLLAAGFAALL